MNLSSDYMSVKNWWNVCLGNGRLNMREYKWNTTQSKKELYHTYKTMCVGDAKGILMFWKYLNQLVNFVYEDTTTVQFPSLDECRDMNMDWKTDLESGFVAKRSLSL